MHFTASVLALAASAAVCNGAAVPNGAPTLTYWSLDNVKRTIHCTPNAGYASISPVKVDNSKNTTVTFPYPWIGNCYAVQEGKANTPGMLAEVNFGGWQGKTYFDVSAIVDPTDINNVKQMWAASDRSINSGCAEYKTCTVDDAASGKCRGCSNAYYVWDDVQTKVTQDRNLIVTLGEGSTGINF